MKLVSFVTANGPGYGVVKDGGVVDLRRRFGDRLPTLRALLSAGALPEAERIARDTAPDFPLDGLQLAPVIPDPDKIICIGMNYRDRRGRTDCYRKTGTLCPLCRQSGWASSAAREAGRIRSIRL